MITKKEYQEGKTNKIIYSTRSRELENIIDENISNKKLEMKIDYNYFQECYQDVFKEYVKNGWHILLTIEKNTKNIPHEYPSNWGNGYKNYYINTTTATLKANFYD